MWIVLLIVIAAVFFITKKGDIGLIEWLRSLDVVIRIGIFTGIIALVFSAFSPIMAESQTDSLGLFSLIAGILVYVSLGCFLYTFVVYLYRVLFGGE